MLGLNLLRQALASHTQEELTHTTAAAPPGTYCPKGIAARWDIDVLQMWCNLNSLASLHRFVVLNTIQERLKHINAST